jgi:hypothetical protein
MSVRTTFEYKKLLISNYKWGEYPELDALRLEIKDVAQSYSYANYIKEQNEYARKLEMLEQKFIDMYRILKKDGENID